MTTIKIPPTVPAITDRLGTLEGLITARQWERAALIWAATYEGVNQNDPPAQKGAGGRLAIAAFAGLGIHGLSKRDTVAAYRAQWRRAMDHGAPDVGPGDTVAVPDLPWKEWPDDAPGGRDRRYTANDPEAFARSLGQRVDVEAFADALPEPVARRVASRVRERIMAEATEHADDASPRVLGTLANRLAATPYERAMRLVHQIGIIARDLRPLLVELDEDESASLMGHIGQAADVMRMLADTAGAADLDAELAALLTEGES
jgi:hypothetical protein